MANVEAGGKIVLGLVEALVLFEILWYYLHDGEQTLHEALAEWYWRHKLRSLFYRDVAETQLSIRDLPESE